MPKLLICGALELFFHEVKHHWRNFKRESLAFFNVAPHYTFFANRMRCVQYMHADFCANLGGKVAEISPALQLSEAKIENGTSIVFADLRRCGPDLSFTTLDTLHDPRQAHSLWQVRAEELLHPLVDGEPHGILL